MISSLLYFTSSRPDIAFSVSICARYQSCPKESHMAAVKRIIKYVNGTLGFGIWYSWDTNLNVVGFTNADWAGSVWMIAKVLQVDVSTLKIISSLGTVRNKILSLYLLLRLSTLLQGVVALNFYG